MTEPEAAEAETAEQTGETKTNQVNGSVTTSVQINEHQGDIKLINAPPAKDALVTLWLNDDEMADLKEQFVPSAQFDRACTVLRDNPVIVLCGAGTGRTFTGSKLLLHHGHTEIAYANGARELGSIEESELRQGAGYLWQTSAVSTPAFHGRDVDQVSRILRAADCRLVIIVDDESQVPVEAGYTTVGLSRPDAIEVATAVVRHRGGNEREAAMGLLKGDFAPLLCPDDRPDKMKYAANLAIGVAREQIGLAAALETLTEKIDHTIAAMYQGWSVQQFAMLLAVAVLENQPFDEVAERAVMLDAGIRATELAKDEEFKPLLVFARSKNQLLRDIRAETTQREHPTHAGLKEETVRFVRDGWAEAALCHIWREYINVRVVLLNWMCSSEVLKRFPWACVDALCRIITRMPSHEPLRMVEYLAGGISLIYREFASWTLVKLADVRDLGPVVESTLTEWVDKGSATRRATAAMTYAFRYAETAPEIVLDRLKAIASKTKAELARKTVYHLVLYVLRHAPANRPIVLRELCTWAGASRRRDAADGPRQIALAVGRWVTGLAPNPDKDYVQAADMIADHRAEVAVLAWKILMDPEHGPTALNRLLSLANTAYYDGTARAEDSTEPASTELIRFLTLLTPDLRWWPSLRTVIAIGRQHPTRRKQIRWIFRVARKRQ